MPSSTPRPNDHPSTLRSARPAAVATVFLLAAFGAGCSSTSTTEPVVTTTRTPGTTTADARREARVGSYLEPNDAAVGAVVDSLGDGPFVMLNLFRLREVPDFATYPELKPSTPMNSRDLFYRYIAHMDGFLKQVGAKRVLLAEGGPMLIGPSGEHWDVVQMVEYPSKQSFIELGRLVRDEVPQRAVMLSDSRIMPMHDVPLDAVERVG